MSATKTGHEAHSTPGRPRKARVAPATAMGPAEAPASRYAGIQTPESMRQHEWLGDSTVTRAKLVPIFKDRLDGLLVVTGPRTATFEDDDIGNDPSRLQHRLWRVLGELVEGTARRDITDGDDIVSELQVTIERRIVEWAVEREAERLVEATA